MLPTSHTALPAQSVSTEQKSHVTLNGNIHTLDNCGYLRTGMRRTERDLSVVQDGAERTEHRPCGSVVYPATIGVSICIVHHGRSGTNMSPESAARSKRDRVRGAPCEARPNAKRRAGKRELRICRGGSDGQPELVLCIAQSAERRKRAPDSNGREAWGGRCGAVYRDRVRCARGGSL